MGLTAQPSIRLCAISSTLATAPPCSSAVMPLSRCRWRGCGWRIEPAGQRSKRLSRICTSAACFAALGAQQMRQSMSRNGDCWDNAVAESFFATLEHDLLAHTVPHSHHDANVAVTDFIEHWYNGERQHSTLNYVSPQQYENQLRQMARAA